MTTPNGTTNDGDSASMPTSLPQTGEECISSMNASFAKCLSLVAPPIQYPPHCRFNPVQQDAADLAEIEIRLEEFFVHAKQLELCFIREQNELEIEEEIESDIVQLEMELNDKNELIEKYTEVLRGWESKFKRLDRRLTPE